jgi:hypothetical protein
MAVLPQLAFRQLQHLKQHLKQAAEHILLSCPAEHWQDQNLVQDLLDQLVQQQGQRQKAQLDPVAPG